MKVYTVKVTCEYYQDVVAKTEDEAIQKCINKPDYTLGNLQNFEYEINDEEEYKND